MKIWKFSSPSTFDLINYSLLNRSICLPFRGYLYLARTINNQEIWIRNIEVSTGKQLPHSENKSALIVVIIFGSIRWNYMKLSRLFHDELPSKDRIISIWYWLFSIYPLELNYFSNSLFNLKKRFNLILDWYNKRYRQFI